MSDPRAVDRLEYKTADHRTAGQKILEVAKTGLEVAHIGANVAKIIGHWGATVADLGYAATFSAILLPIDTFVLGTRLRMDDDEFDEQTAALRSVILNLAVEDAIETYLLMNKNTKLRDNKAPHGIRFSTVDPSRSSTAANYLASTREMWLMVYKRWWNKLEGEVKAARLGKIVTDKVWESFVKSRFHQISAEFQGILAQAESLRVNPVSGFGREPRTLSDREERTFGRPW
jgi:hypothetical protein